MLTNFYFDFSKMVKDCYIIALPKNKPIHPCLMPLDGPGLDEDRKDVLLALIVRSKRKRSHDGTPVSSSSKRSKKSPIEDVQDTQEDTETNTYIPTPVSADEKPYNPELAGLDHSSSRQPRLKIW